MSHSRFQRVREQQVETDRCVLLQRHARLMRAFECTRTTRDGVEMVPGGGRHDAVVDFAPE